jgi:hypothetical protein
MLVDADQRNPLVNHESGVETHDVVCGMRDVDDDEGQRLGRS